MTCAVADLIAPDNKFQHYPTSFNRQFHPHPKHDLSFWESLEVYFCTLCSNKSSAHILQWCDGNEALPKVFVCGALIAINHIDPASHHLISIGCEITFADQMVCSDGLNLGFAKLTVPVVIACQVCDRAHCPNAQYHCRKRLPHLASAGVTFHQELESYKNSSWWGGDEKPACLYVKEA